MFVPTEAVVDDAVLAQPNEGVILLTVVQEELGEIGDGLGGGVDEIKLLQCILDISRVRKAFGYLWRLVWEPKRHKGAPIDDGISRATLVMGAEIAVRLAIIVTVVNHDCRCSCWVTDNEEDWGRRGCGFAICQYFPEISAGEGVALID